MSCTSSVSNEEEANDMCRRKCEKGKNILQTSMAVSLTSSPVSVVPSIIDDDSAQSSIVQSMPEGAEMTACNATRHSTSNKSVRFSDVNKIFMDNNFAEKVHKYRANIWYTVRCFKSFGCCHSFNCMYSWHPSYL